MNVNKGKSKPESSGKPAPQELGGLKGRVRKLNQLVGQHAAARGSVTGSVAASAPPQGGGRGGNGSEHASESSGSTRSVVPLVNAPRKKKKQKKSKATQTQEPIRVRGPDGDHFLPATMMPKKRAGPVKRTYVDAKGRPVATSKVATQASEFERRGKLIRDPKFTEKAVGLNTSQLYHGTSPMEMDFVRNGVRGTRLAGSQYLDVVQPGASNIQLGNRLTIALVNPAALGSILKKMSQVYEQVKFNHFKIVYKPVVPATTDGSIAIYFRNDTSNPIYEIGLDELQAASTHQAFVETTVWTPASIDVQPSDMVLRYWDEMNGDFADEVQGMVTVIATSNLVADETYGHLYLEYDAEFYSPELDAEVDEVGIFEADLTWSVVNTGGNTNIFGTFAPIAGGTISMQWIGQQPPSSEFLAYGVITHVDGANLPTWATPDDTETHSFTPGSGIYMRFEQDAGSTGWTDGTRYAYFYVDLETASATDAPGLDLKGGQMYYGTSLLGTSGNFRVRVKMVELAEGQE